MLRRDGPDLRYGDLVVREELQQERLELLVGPGYLVYEEDGRLIGLHGLEDRPLHEEVLGEEDVLLPAQDLGRLAQALGRREGLPDLLPEDLRVQELLAVLPLVELLRLVEPLVALEPVEIRSAER